MSEKTFKVIGLSDSRNQWFPPEVLSLIKEGKVFCGGKRHFEIIRNLLPKEGVWIDITVPLDDVWKKLEEYDEINVFASGDPFFYGFAATLQRVFPNCRMTVFPTFNSIQMLAHKLLLPYADVVNVSLTGRPWDALDVAVIENRSLIGILTDKKKGPAEIASRLLDYGYNNYIAYVGESLGNEEKEKVSRLTLEEMVNSTFSNPNCVILQMTVPRKRFFGIPDSEFFHLQGREKMITKMPVRLLTISMLDLYCRESLWDIGFCTGSISIESKLQFPHLQITAFERRLESKELLVDNCKKFGAPGINGIITDFMEADLSIYPSPDAVFIGGHGGRLREMIQRIKQVLKHDGIIVFNSVTPESCGAFIEAISAVGMTIVDSHSITIDDHNTIKIFKAQ